MEKGTLVLTTNGGERKMSYSLIDGTYYMSTTSDSNKVKQINADNQVTIDLDDKVYTAQLISKDKDSYQAAKATYLSAMGGFQTFMHKYVFGRKSDMMIILK